tara:strand:+ start:11776 stop:13212 length:1437 start_codon:yes stop_codon:yes gene_type:complete
MPKRKNNKAPKKTLKQKRLDDRAAFAVADNYRDPWRTTYVDKSYQESLTKWKKDRNTYYSELREASRSRYNWSSVESNPMSIMTQTVKALKADKAAVSHLIEVCRRSKILDIDDSEKYIKGLVILANYKCDWINNPDFWKPKTKNRERQFYELVHFLLTKYDTPKFFNSCWFETDTEAKMHQRWFINLGHGENIRKQEGIPLKLTKRMAHEFTCAPQNITVKKAFRWAQMKSMGANERQIQSYLGLPIATTFAQNDEFWITVMRFFIDNPLLDPYQYQNIYDYIMNQRFINQDAILVEDEWVERGPVQPNFNMQRRNPEILMRQIEAWHLELNAVGARRRENLSVEMRKREENRRLLSWKPSNIGNFKIKKGKDKQKKFFLIKELLTGGELMDDGYHMSHCVSSYITSCQNGYSSIFSMMEVKEGNESPTRLLTIEVRLTDRVISQARGKYNAAPTSEERTILSNWAIEKGLKMSDWV